MDQGESEGTHGWGRVRGTRPPISPIAPLVWWLVTALVLAAVVLGVVGAPGPLDDPREADQRPGLLIDVAQAREVRGLELPGGPVGRRPVVIIFDRAPPKPDRLRTFVEQIPGSFAVVLVAARDRAAAARRVRSVGDPAGRIAEVVGMPQPGDGGPPVGYALIDREARVRYATLDPTYPEHGFEVEVVAGALG